MTDSSEGRRNATSIRQKVASGLFWNMLSQFAMLTISFGSMLVMVRLVSAQEYGRAGCVLGVLTALGVFNAQVFVAQALQLPDGAEPDWSQHFNAAIYIQFSQFLVCNLVGLAFWFVPAFKQVAALLHLASVGLLLEVSGTIGNYQLVRALNYRRLRVVQFVGRLVVTALVLLMAYLGWGAVAIILGSSVLRGLPYGIDLLLFRGWRPRSGWWRWPDLREYRKPLEFGGFQFVSHLLGLAVSVLESLLMPVMLGYQALGLRNRAAALYTLSLGQLNQVVTDTGYPILPRYVDDPARFARMVRLLLQASLIVALPGTAYLCCEGPRLVRVLYGARWVLAEPLVAPASLGMLGVALNLFCFLVVMALGRLRSAASLKALLLLCSLPAFGLLLGRITLLWYLYLLAGGQLVACLISLIAIRSQLDRGLTVVLLPPLVCSLAAGAAHFALASATAELGPLPGLAAHTGVFWLAVALIARIVFPGYLLEVLGYLPGQAVVRRLLAFGSRDTEQRA